MMGKRWKNILINGVYIIEETANSRKALIEQNKNENEGQYIERTAYNMGDNSKKEQFAIRNRTAEGWCVCVCLLLHVIGVLSFICSTSQVYFCFVCFEEDQGGLTYMYITAKDST